jgi:cation:H+ antiporter
VDHLKAGLERAGHGSPWLMVALFLAGSLLLLWRLEALAGGGMEGTVLGTLVMPYCSGIGNLIFAFLLGRQGGNGGEVMTNCLVNNVTNMTLLIGLPAVIWGMNLAAPTKGKKAQASQLNRLSMLLTLLAVLFFTGAVWVLGRDGWLDFNDGVMLVGLFLFWQCFQAFDALKSNVRQNKSFGWMLPVNLLLLGVGAFAVYVSIEWLLQWISRVPTGLVSVKNLGWLSGWLMVLPNAMLAFYYGWKRQPEVVYTSQVGDGHICIPFCIGIFALFHPFAVPASFPLGVQLLAGATVVHFVCVALFGQLPRIVGLLLVVGYGVFVAKGLGN